MDCNERQRLQEEWLSEHDRLCVALDEYERKLATIKHFDQAHGIASVEREACDTARQVLDEHERVHGCSDAYVE